MSCWIVGIVQNCYGGILCTFLCFSFEGCYYYRQSTSQSVSNSSRRADHWLWYIGKERLEELFFILLFFYGSTVQDEDGMSCASWRTYSVIRSFKKLLYCTDISFLFRVTCSKYCTVIGKSIVCLLSSKCTNEWEESNLYEDEYSVGVVKFREKF